jgi:hypothetical protein
MSQCWSTEAVSEAPGAYLAKDSWNANGYSTTFILFVRLQDGTMACIGFLGIGNIAMERDGWSRMSALDLLRSARPSRTFRRHRGQRHFTGSYWSATT